MLFHTFKMLGRKKLGWSVWANVASTDLLALLFESKSEHVTCKSDLSIMNVFLSLISQMDIFDRIKKKKPWQIGHANKWQTPSDTKDLSPSSVNVQVVQPAADIKSAINRIFTIIRCDFENVFLGCVCLFPRPDISESIPVAFSNTSSFVSQSVLAIGSRISAYLSPRDTLF